MAKFKDEFIQSVIGVRHRVSVSITKEGVFVAKLPEEFTGLSDRSDGRFEDKTLEGALKKVTAEISRLETSTAFKKVLIVDFNGSATLYRKGGLVESFGTNYNNRSEYIELNLTWRILLEKEVAGEKRYFKDKSWDDPFEKDEKKVHHIRYEQIYLGDSSTVMEWTPERQAFLEALEDRIVDSIKKLQKFFGGGSKKIAEFIDTRGLLAGSQALLGLPPKKES